MSLLISKNDVKELACKFKGHYASENEIEKITSTPTMELETSCQRCNFGIKVKLDPEDPNYYIVTEIE